MTLLTHSRARSADRSGSFGQVSRSSSNDSYSQKLTNTANNLVNRIRRLSPASWRRRTSDQNDSMKSIELGVKPQLRSQSNVDLPRSSTANTSYDNSLDSVTFENMDPASMASFADSILTTNSEPCDATAYQMLNTFSIYRDFCELHYPDQSVWELKEKFPNTFISLTTAYMRSVELSTKEMAELQQMVKEQNLLDSSPLRRGRSHNNQANKQKKLKSRWYFIVNHLIRYLIIGQKYKQKFILRRPGNQIFINQLEEQLVKLINSPGVEISSRDLDALLNSSEVSVIGCVLSRLLRRHGALFGEPLASMFRQIISENPTRCEEDLSREQRKSLRMLFLLKSRKFRDLLLRPLLELLTKIAQDDFCQVDESSLAVLFAPIFFIDSQPNNQKCAISIADKDLPKAVEKVIRICKQEYAKNGSIASMFKLSKLFLFDCIQNLHSNSVCKSPNDMQPLHCSIRYCVPMTPSPNKKTPTNSKLQRSHAFLSNSREAVEQNTSSDRKLNNSLLDIIGKTQDVSSLSDFSKQNSPNSTPRRKVRVRVEEANREKLKRPRTMISDSTTIKSTSPVFDSSRPIIKSALIEPQINFRVRKKASAMTANNDVKTGYSSSSEYRHKSPSRTRKPVSVCVDKLSTNAKKDRMVQRGVDFQIYKVIAPIPLDKID